MSTLTEAAQQALEALEQDNPAGRSATITALRAALAQQEQQSPIDRMWQRLTEHQPFADQRGYGEAWRAMCRERTAEAARAAAWEAADAADAAARAAADAAWAAARAAADAADAAARAAWAIHWIEKAEGK